MQSEPSDHELMAAAGRGDREALGLLFERHQARVHALCYRMTGDASVADDLVQESFLRVFRYGRSFGERAAFTTWLYRLVRNVCLQHLNAESHTHARIERMAAEHGSGSRTGTRDAPGTGEEDPRLVSLRRALYALSPDKREVLVLSRYQGLSYAEIAEVCETTVGAIKVRAHRAMRELRRRYEELEAS